MSECDYIIVGGGSAGCAVANRLSAEPAHDVVLLDAGRSDRHLFVRIPAGMGMIMPREDMVWHHMAEADPTRAGRTEMWPAGKCLGGGSAINGMMFVRGHRRDYDHWAELGNPGWSYDEVLPYFRRLETSDRGPNDYRGGDGPQHVADNRISHPLIDSFMAGAQELGVAYNDDLNGASQEGVGRVQASQRRGMRHSTASAYIWPVKSRRNLDVQLQALVSRVLFDGRRAVGVEYRHKGESRRLLARKGVIISAGAMASPKLLMLSGVGDPDALRAHDIQTVLELPGVGKNLQEHPGASMRMHVNIDTINSDLGPLRSIVHGLNYLLDGSGPLSTPIAHAQAFINTRAGLPAPNIQVIFSVVAHELVEGSARAYPKPAISFAIGLCRVSSRGEIRLRSNSIDAPPIIDYELLSEADDVLQITEGCRFVRELVRTPALSKYVVDEPLPGASVESDAQWQQYLHESSILMYHPCGSCKMGNDEQAVVDHRLRVRGAEALWVADASIIPTIPAGNINASCIMIGEKAADMIAQDS